jgi:hypothetical protein
MLDVREQRCSLKDVSKSHPNVTPFQVKSKLDLVSTFLPEGVTKDTLTSFAYSRAMRQAAGVTSESRRLYTDEELRQALLGQMVLVPPATQLDTHADTKAKFGVSKTTIKFHKKAILVAITKQRRTATPALLKVQSTSH